MTTSIICTNSINALANKEIKSNLREMLTALETGKKATWQYAIAVSKIIGSEMYKEDFHDLKKFAEYVNSSKATLSQYNNAVAFMVRENLIPSKEVKQGKTTKLVPDYSKIQLTVFNAYILSTLSEIDYNAFYLYCNENDIQLFNLSQNALKKAIEDWRNSYATEETETEETATEETETEEQESVNIKVDTKEKALVAIATLMKQFNITLEEIAGQEE